MNYDQIIAIAKENVSKREVVEAMVELTIEGVSITTAITGSIGCASFISWMWSFIFIYYMTKLGLRLIKHITFNLISKSDEQ